MSHWDYRKGKVIYWPTRKSKDWPGWVIVDCGCSGGIKWGGEYPGECNRCNGTGVIFRHQKSGVVKNWPGGQFIG
jgi:hypothetical protein